MYHFFFQLAIKGTLDCNTQYPDLWTRIDLERYWIDIVTKYENISSSQLEILVEKNRDQIGRRKNESEMQMKRNERKRKEYTKGRNVAKKNGFALVWIILILIFF